MAESFDFGKTFEALTGHRPFPWQERLFDKFKAGEIPPTCNLPTGLGKTNVIAVWLIAWKKYPHKTPRRLVYVVNRRTVVDQTTNEAIKLRDNARKIGIDDLAISTLRGQFADNREWSADPSRPAVICGTVDMIGSRLLFSGYGIGFKSRPLHAGFLGQDVLLVHDEAHLEPAFQQLITEIEKEQTRERLRNGDLPWPKLRVMQLTATTRNDNDQDAPAFSLTSDDQEHPVVKQRLEAHKQLNLTPVEDDKQVAGKIAEIAADHKDGNAAVLVFVRTLEAVGTVEKGLKETGRPVVLLTGTIRGKERDELVKKPEFKRFLKGAETGDTVYLVCTSAGEVGIDISADHMVCDLSTFESMAQRFGRVNRFGEREDTHIDVVHPEAFDEKDKLAPARQATLRLLEQLRGDASPQALSKLDPEQRKAAFAPEPTTLPTTDILFDAWALTTIRDKMPGRPAVEPYLHGIAEWQPAETYVAWRAEVEIVSGDLLERYEPEDLLDDYPLKPHELLRDATDRKNTGVFAQLSKMARRMPEAIIWIIDAQGAVKPAKLQEVINGGSRGLYDATVILPPSVGGLTTAGTLDGDAQFSEEFRYDVADVPSSPGGARIRVWLDDPAYESKIVDMRRVCTVEIDTSADEEAEPRRWEWYESIPQEGGRTAKKAVRLDTHVSDVTRHARRIVAGLSLPQDIGDALLVAVSLHDRGKRREQFQIALGNRNLDVPWAKSGRSGTRLPEPFRHEFASVLDAQADADVNNLKGGMADLVLHLIATHHGRARPHFSTDEAFDPDRQVSDTEALSIEIPRRFARLQCRYGRWGLAYLESLVRAADWAASANPSAFVDTQQEDQP